MRRAVTGLVGVVGLLLLAPPPATAAGPTVVIHDSFEVEFSGQVPYCPFPLLTTIHEEHSTQFRYADLPEGVDPLSSIAVLYQVVGTHFVDLQEVVTNPANSRTVEIHRTSRLIRRDFDTSNITVGPNGLLTGTLTATDHVSVSVVATAPGGSPVLLIAGHQRSYHASFIVDDIRIGRLDTSFFAAGVQRSDLCSYLA